MMGIPFDPPPVPQRGSGDAGATAGGPGAEAIPAIPFDPVPVRPRRDGWTAEKQRRFIRILAETGVVRHAAAAVGMSEESAHRLAQRPDAERFCDAWDAALRMAARPAAARLYEYALDGVTETVWRDGEIVYRRRRPSEKALIFLLSRLDPARYGRPPAAPAPKDLAGEPIDNLAETAGLFDLYLANLTDLPPEESPGEAPETGHG